ncbi:unnamed protein product, partial [Prorocentrum cordatum]
VTVQVSEIEPARAGGRERSDSGRGRSDSSLSSGGRALPATYQARGGQQDLNGDVSFPTGATCRFVQTTLGSGWRLRFEVQDEGLSMRAVPLAFAEIGADDLARQGEWRLLLSDPRTYEAVYGGPNEAGVVRAPAFLLVHTQAFVALAQDPTPRGGASSAAPGLLRVWR